ncbi:flagellar biosynthetic protein FliR [Kineococcus xinjiangensis]|uniref:Flagellar biosynthetic protein FliR n=1 Tax=Kineococcus xinjiangensis TaxID=512762 RepID=A0A2S6IJZ5_9ACTN|nr:flagellar biosynthetic protein FliR [Kineococcus xinjiangensis]PPK94529.1 flagellar biosynthetic protein FliR [Kineococcus xinjiangensis]
MEQVHVPLDLLLALLLASVRITAWLVFAPPFSNRAVNARVKAMLGLAIALPMAERLRGQAPVGDPAAIVTAVAQQVLVGVALGALCALVFAAVQAAGDLIDLFGGFQLASAYDPLQQSQTAVFGKLYGWVSTALLVTTGGHLIVLNGFLGTFDVVPLNQAVSLGAISALMTDGVVRLFASALQIAAPLIAVLFVTDVGLGLLSRAAPALQVFAMSFPLKILVTLTLGGFAMALLPHVHPQLVETAVESIGRAVS